MSQTLKLYIPKVLSENKIVLLKGIGTLRMSYRTAQSDNELAVISAPREEIYFVPGDENQLDPILVKVVEMIARVDHDEATNMVQQFMLDLRLELRGNGFLTFPNIGWIKQDNWGSLFFEPAAEYIAINRFFGLGQVSLPEPLTQAERDALDDLKETVSEQTEHARMMHQKQPQRVWGFIIGAFLLLLTVVTALLLTDLPGGEMSVASHDVNPELTEKPEADKKLNESPPLLTGHSVNPKDTASAAMPIEQIEDEPNVEPEKPVLVKTAVVDCVVVVGAFVDQNNVDRMVARLERTNRESVVISGSRLTKVGVKVDCNRARGQTLEWARNEIDPESWVYKND